ncbi:DoxX family protein [Burkholderia plantarii]|uniref:DoxX family protein n=1 Tax=Burkholderia plantarii TaxID=41899 RepID=UPI00272B09FC|nr:DoxX family protein [Burkholderia plantarii]WLE62757.1 DoxX family protein [Burkholderia plantarii]
MPAPSATSSTSCAASYRAALGAALPRVSLGAILLTHGLPKLLHTAHGAMADPMASSIRLIRDGAGLPFAPQLATLVMLIETAGALLLMLGLGTRAVALAIFAEMIGIARVLGPTWPWLERGIEYPVLMGCVALSIALTGGGPWSLDAWWRRRG